MYRMRCMCRFLTYLSEEVDVNNAKSQLGISRCHQRGSSPHFHKVESESHAIDMFTRSKCMHVLIAKYRFSHISSVQFFF